MFENIQSFFTTRPRRNASSLGAGASPEDDPAMPAFQKAWKDGALVEDLFGPSPFTLHGTVGRSGADNFRPDVAKVETFLGDAGYYKPLTSDGPSGWHNSNLDQAIRSFQKEKGLEVDGFLKPGGPTIGKIGGLLGTRDQVQTTTKPDTQTQNFWGGPKGDWPGVLLPGDEHQSPPRPGSRDSGLFDPPTTFPMPKPQPPSGNSNRPGGELTPQQQLEALIRIMNGGKTPDPRPQPPVINERPQSTLPRFPPIGNDLPEQGGITGTLPRPHDWNRLLQGHTINQEGSDANQGYAEMLVRDSDPSQTARMLKRAIDDYGDQGRGDVADLLARFQKLDGAKAETLRREIHKVSGEMLPYRLAPLGEGFREPTEEERIAAAPKTPFGSAQGADRWAAGNMAEVLLGRGNYADAITHFRGEIGRNRAEAMPYLAAVHEIMGEKSPAQAASFATQMQKAGLAVEAEKKPEAPPEQVSTPTPAPTPAQEPLKPEPAPQPQPVPPTPPATQPPESNPAPVPPEATPPVQGKPEPGKGGPIITPPIPPEAKPGPTPPTNPGEKDIVQPPGAPGEPMKPAPDLHPSVTIEFDGKEFKAIEDGKVVKSWPAVSGRPGYQGAEHQGEKDKGPLPEGEWVLRQDQLQSIDKLSEWERLKGRFGGSTWPGLEDSWGKTRVWLEPGQGTDTKGRGGFSVHGGKTPGSAGCIDLTDQMEDFADYFRNMGKDVTVRVNYRRK